MKFEIYNVLEVFTRHLINQFCTALLCDFSLLPEEKSGLCTMLFVFTQQLASDPHHHRAV